MRLSILALPSTTWTSDVSEQQSKHWNFAVYSLACLWDTGVLALNNIYMHPNSVCPQHVNNGSARAELLHCAATSPGGPRWKGLHVDSRSGKLSLSRPPEERGGRSEAPADGLFGNTLVRLLPTASILDTISGQRCIFAWLYLLFDETVCVLLRNAQFRDQKM